MQEQSHGAECKIFEKIFQLKNLVVDIYSIVKYWDNIVPIHLERFENWNIY